MYHIYICIYIYVLVYADMILFPGKRGVAGGPGPVGPPGYCQFCGALAMQANRGSQKKGPVG